jgi:ABC-2 type transport system ATP-binding protein
VGWAPESPSLPLRATPHELIAAAARLSGAGDADEALGRLDLVAVAHRPLGTLSQGTRERVALAQALVHRPDLVLLDEPLTGLDATGRARVLEVLSAEKARGVALLVATHWPDVLAPLADRGVALRDGILEPA